MAYAVVLRVNLVGDRDEGMKMLDDAVIPHVKSLPGFQRGTWMNNATAVGTAVVVFDTEDNANRAVEHIQPPPGGPTVIDCGVFEVAREA